MAASLEWLSGGEDGRAGRVELARKLEERLVWLRAADRQLVELYVRHGLGVRQLARVKGLAASTVSRRLRRQIGALLDGRYAAVRGERRRFSGAERQVAYDWFLLGLSVRAIAGKRRLPAGQVRDITARLEVWVRKAASG